MGVEFLETPTEQKTYTQIFEECFPFYLAIGMSFEEYWVRDPKLTQYYRKAYKIKQEEINNNAWLQGLYFYDALSCSLHNALRGFGKNKLPPQNYAKKPYEFNKEKTEKEKALEKEKERQKAIAWMESFVRINKSHRANNE